MTFIKDLEIAYTLNADAERAKEMERYMKLHFVFLGMKTDLRRVLLKELWKKHKEEIQRNSRTIATELFKKEHREYHYSAIEIIMKELKNNYLEEDIQFIEKLIITHSWWDSVDKIAKNILGNYLMEFPHQTATTIEYFSNSNNLWLNRSAILFQLCYKEKTNTEYLFSECEKHAGSTAFFIQKAIGWALREYAKTNPVAVMNFVENTNLKPLSKREALKHF